jgi:hypothetical protein
VTDPERRRRVEELCDAALHRDARERAAFVATDLPESRGVAVHGVNSAARCEHVGERERERSLATSQIDPGCHAECLDGTVGEHLNRVTQPHQGIIAMPSRAGPPSRGSCQAADAASSGSRSLA